MPTNPYDFPRWATPSQTSSTQPLHCRQHTQFLSGQVLRHIRPICRTLRRRSLERASGRSRITARRPRSGILWTMNRSPRKSVLASTGLRAVSCGMRLCVNRSFVCMRSAAFVRTLADVGDICAISKSDFEHFKLRHIFDHATHRLISQDTCSHTAFYWIPKSRILTVCAI